MCPVIAVRNRRFSTIQHTDQILVIHKGLIMNAGAAPAEYEAESAGLSELESGSPQEENMLLAGRMGKGMGSAKGTPPLAEMQAAAQVAGCSGGYTAPLVCR